MSDTYFRQQFRQEFGLTPIRYINRLRLQTAVELLQSGYYTVSEVADRCGFRNIQYFSAFVRRESGLTPQQHRKKLYEPSPEPSELFRQAPEKRFPREPGVRRK